MSIRSSLDRSQSAWIVVLDFLCLLAGSYLAVWLRFESTEWFTYVFHHIDGWVIFFSGVIVANYLAGSYRIQYTTSRFNLLVIWIFAVSFAMFILSLTSYAWFRMLLGRGVLFLAILFYSIFSICLRLVAYHRIFGGRFLQQRVVIAGCDDRAVHFKHLIQNPYVLPTHSVTAMLDLQPGSPDSAKDVASDRPRLLDGAPVIPALPNELHEIITSLDTHLVVLSMRQETLDPATFNALRRVRFSGIEVLPALTAAEIYSGRTPLDLLDEDDILAAGLETGSPMLWRFKRIADLMVSLIGMLVCSPLVVVIAVTLKLTEPRDPVLYKQTRVGKFGQVFRIIKFRTMRVDAEDESGAVWSAPDDPRVTPLGRILRRFRMDEIPQFWNILRGEMSLVGPRPERPELVASLVRHIPYYDERENVMPGITGWAQIQYPYGNSIEDARRKLEYDLFYIRNLSISLDLQIVLRTLRTVLFGRETRETPHTTGTTAA